MMKHFVTQAIEEKKDLIVNVSDQIFDFAEVGFHEFKTADLYEKVLKEEGFRLRWVSQECRQRSKLHTAKENR